MYIANNFLTYCAHHSLNYISVSRISGPELTELETVPVIFTRLQYAKVLYQNFHVPKKFHGASRIVGGTECRKLTKSFDIGCRLTCGFEAIYQRAKSERASNVKTRMRDTNVNFESKVFYSDTCKQEQDLCTIIDSILENRCMDHREEAQTDSNINDGFSETKRSRNLLEAFVKICDKIPGDSDSWMYLSPEELDLEMESRVKKIQNENLKSATDTKNISANTVAVDPIVDERHSKYKMKNKKDSEDKNVEENPSSDHLMKMLEGMKSFLGTKSGPDGIEGIQNSASHIKSGKPNQKKNADTSVKIINENMFEGVSEFNDTPSINKTMKMVENNCDDETPHEFNFDFDKFKEILKKFGENDDGCETRNQPLNLSSDPSSNLLGDYFYERDLEELSSDDDSDYDSDDEVDYDKKSSRIEPVQYERNKQNKRENLKNLDEAVVISKESDNKDVEDNISVAIIGIKNIKIESKPVKDSGIGTRPKFDGRAEYDSTVASFTPSSTIKVSLAGSDVNSSKTLDCAKVNTNFSNLNLQGIHDNVHTTTTSSSNPNTNPKDSKYNNDNNIIRKDNDDDDNDDTDSFYDESETDSDDEIEIRPTARTNHGRATSSSRNNADNLRSLEEEEDGRIDEDYDEINEGKYFEEYEVRNTNIINHFFKFVC